MIYIDKLKKTLFSSKESVIPLYILIFGYGVILLMIGYTQAGLARLLFPKNVGNIVYVLLAQSLGVAFMSFFLWKIINHVRPKWICFFSYLNATAMILLIVFLKNMNLKSDSFAIIFLFILFIFLLGFGIGVSTPLCFMIINNTWKGHTKTKYMSIANGLFSIGAGIIPLFFAKIIIESTSSRIIDFDTIRIFYFAAAGIALILAINSLFIKYKVTSSQKLPPIKDIWNRKFWMSFPLLMMYIFVASTFTYMFVNLTETTTAKTFSNIPKNIGLHAIQAYGTYSLVQGFWNIFSGLYLLKKIDKTKYIFMSFIFVLIGITLIFCGFLKYFAMQYVISVIMGIGIGNNWVVIYEKILSKFELKKRTSIGFYVNMFGIFTIALTEAVTAPIWSEIVRLNSTNSIFYFTPFIVSLIFTIIFLIYFYFYDKRFKET